MNRLCVVGFMGLLFLLINTRSFAQIGNAPATSIKPYEIAVSYNQTTNLIFPYAVKSVDRGSGAVLAQKAKGVENILQLKAGKADFTPTNVSVITADGTFYSFMLTYADQPSCLTMSFAQDKQVQFTDESSNVRQLEGEARQVLNMCGFIHRGQTAQALSLRLTGIYLSESTLWLKLRLHNNVQVDFQPASVRFFLRDKKRSKRTALHETEIFPVYAPAYDVTKGAASSTWTLGFKPFTVPKHQRLIIQVGDESGGRQVMLRIPSRLILKGRRL